MPVTDNVRENGVLCGKEQVFSSIPHNSESHTLDSTKNVQLPCQLSKMRVKPYQYNPISNCFSLILWGKCLLLEQI